MGPGLAATERISEIDVRGGAGIEIDHWHRDEHGNMARTDGVRGIWTVPAPFLRSTLGAQPHGVFIIEVVGDSMDPTLRPGDRVFVDTNHTRPSPPGIFAIYDGYGIVVKRLELLPETDPPRVRLISDNRNHQPYEASLADARIIGRVAGRISVL